MLHSSAILALAFATGENLFVIDEAMLAREPSQSAARASSAIAIIPVRGALSPRTVSGFFGSTNGMDRLRAQLAAAADNQGVGAIVLDIDSPGGTVAGTPETAEAVRQAAAQKRVVAVADTLAASAAYWIGAQASEFVAAPSADVGSIGVRQVHLDMSGALEKAGIKPTIIASSAAKADIGPFGPLSDEAMAFLQSRVDESNGWFVRDVALGRKTSQANVRDAFGGGRVVGAKQALAAGMIDRIATMPEVLAGLSAKLRKPARRSALAFI